MQQNDGATLLYRVPRADTCPSPPSHRLPKRARHQTGATDLQFRNQPCNWSVTKNYLHGIAESAAGCLYHRHSHTVTINPSTNFGDSVFLSQFTLYKLLF